MYISSNLAIAYLSVIAAIWSQTTLSAVSPFDIGHNYKASEDDESFILSHVDRLRHFHIHDVTKTSNHVALGEGLLDVDRYLDMAQKHNCPVVIEVKEKNDLLKSIEYVRRRSR